HDSDESPKWLLTRDQANDLVTAVLDAVLDEPEPFVRLLLLLFDNTGEPQMQEALHYLMKAAYDNSIVHSFDFQGYLEAIRQGRNPLKEGRAVTSKPLL
ncbi:MAG: hypothetical protein ACREDR_43285, partial [Blastocatellia bacterium]